MTAPLPQTDRTGRTSRAEWLSAALDILVREGIEQVKILRLAEALGTARSSFYWFFESRDALLDALLQSWSDKNTGAIASHAAHKTKTITEAVLHVFECWIDADLFDARLDFAIREWARRDAKILTAIDTADTLRISALTDMFHRHGFPRQQAFIRARILYFTQVGYYALIDNEPLPDRQRYVDDYILGFTGQLPTASERARFDIRLNAADKARR